MKAPAVWNITLGGLLGALKTLSHCPRLKLTPEPVRKNVGLGLCAQQGAFLAGESPAAPSQGGSVDKAGQDPVAL